MHTHSKSLSHTDWRARSLTLSISHSLKEITLTPTPSLFHSHIRSPANLTYRMECRLAHSAASHSHKQSRGHTHSLTSHSHTQRGWRAHSLNYSLTSHSREWEVRVEITLTPTLFHTQIGGHAHSLSHSLSHSLTQSLTHSLIHSLPLTLLHTFLSHINLLLRSTLSLSHSLTHGRGQTHSTH